MSQEIRHQNDKAFHNLLIKARKELLNNVDIDTLNSRIASSIPINDINKNIVIVQQNAIKHIINKFQIKRFAQVNGQDVIFFLRQHSGTKKEGGQVVENRELLLIQDGEGNCIEPRLFFYYKGIPTCLLSNVYTKLEMLNRVWETIQGFIPHHQGKL